MWIHLTSSVDCGPPRPPQRGSLDRYSGSTEGSEVFYRCDSGLVPEGLLRSVCTGNGWSPNPADLNCICKRKMNFCKLSRSKDCYAYTVTRVIAVTVVT